MKTKSLTAACATGLLLVACIPSVNPFYTESDIVFDPALLGAWRDGRDTWRFDRLEDNNFLLTIAPPGEDDAEFEATLFALGEHRFLDIIPHEFDGTDELPDMINMALFPGHIVFHVAEIEPTLRLALFDLDWVTELLEENPKALSHRAEGDRILLTGKTRELQRFLRKHVASTDLFDDYSDMSRLTTE